MPARGGRVLALFALVAATSASAQNPQVQLVGLIVGDLNNANQRAAFDERAQSVCGRLIRVVSERREDAAPSGTLIEQRPPAGQRVACIGSVTLVYSTGQLPPPPPPPPASIIVPIIVPRLDSDSVRTNFAAAVRKRCRRHFEVQIDTVAGPRPRGSYVRQYPSVGRSISCNDGAVAYLSDGSVQQSFRVGVLDSAERRAAFENRASRFCSNPYRLTILSQPDSRVPGTYVSQSVLPDTIFTCASPINVTVTSPLPAWLMPDFRMPGAEARLQQTAAERCQAALPILDRLLDSELTEGTLISQVPRADTPIDCGVTVTLTRAHELAAPPTQLIGDLSTEAGIVAIETVAQRCPNVWQVKRDHRRSSRNSKGAFDGQDPGPTTEFRCELSVVVWTSDGDDKEPEIKVPDVVGHGIGAVDDWMNTVVQLCGAADGVVVVNEQSDEQSGTILDQSLAAGTPYNCGDPVVFTEAVPPPPPILLWLVAIAGGLVVTTVATYRLRTWPWPPIPTLEIGVPTAVPSPADDGQAATLPLVALEAHRPEVTVSYPDGVPIEAVETKNG